MFGPSGCSMHLVTDVLHWQGADKMIEHCSQAGKVGRDKAEGDGRKAKTKTKVKPSEDFLEQMLLFPAEY